MINFSDPKDQVPNTVAVLGIIALLVTLGALLIVPQPTTKGIDAKRNQQIRDLGIEKAEAEERLKEMEAVVEKAKFEEKTELIAASVLAQIEARSKNTKLKLLSFRPQRIVENPQLTQIPFAVNVDGAFPNVLAFLRSFEVPGQKLAVNSLQIASADGSSDQVTAAITVVAFKSPKPLTTTIPEMNKKKEDGAKAEKPIESGTKRSANLRKEGESVRG